ncbi:MAG TPA: SH3 domain-containing protein [Candidatus Acidoferrales bacterium]|nr:SH3 domain-containing protein [Candidatus Acidoferrales bacterium]
MRKLLLGFGLVLVICFALYLRFHHTKRPLEVAYVGSRQVILWNTSAEIREPIATLNYGDRLDVLGHLQQQIRVRTAKGETGWMTQGDLLSADLWQKVQELDSRTKELPIEAHGHTRVISNLHVEPSRNAPRVRQLGKGVAVDLFERQAVEVPVVQPAAVENAATAAPAEPRKEDWWFVRAHSADQTTVAGWILGRFVDLDVPAPLPDYASSAGLHIVAWFELNRAADSSGNAKPQYLLLGTRGPEGQPCDFTLMRVYTWGRQRQRYETAFVESDVCGKLPIKLAPPGPGGDVTFAFEDWKSGVRVERSYQMHQTVVRRVRQPGAAQQDRRNHGAD